MTRAARQVVYGALLGLAMGCGKAPEPRIHVGVLLPLTGPESAAADSIKRGLVLAMAVEIERDGGAELPFRLVYRDTGGATDGGARAMTELIDEHKVPAVVTASGAASRACVEVANRRQVVLLVATPTSVSGSLLGDWAYGTAGTELLEAIAMAQYSVQAGFKRVTVVHAEDAAGSSLSTLYRDELGQRGGTILDSLTFRPGATEYAGLLATLTKRKPDAVYWAGGPVDAAAFLGQARTKKLALKLMGSSALAVNEFLRVAGKDAEGVVMSGPSFDVGANEEVSRGFVAGFRKRYGETPDLHSACAYDAARILIGAVRVGGRDSIAVKRALDAMDGFSGVLGETTFDHAGDAARVPGVHMVRDGAFERINKETRR